MIVPTSFSFRVVPKMNFVRMRRVRHFTCSDTPDQTSLRSVWKVRPDAKETDGLVMAMNLLPVQAWRIAAQGSADPVPTASAPASSFPRQAAMIACTTVVLW